MSVADGRRQSLGQRSAGFVLLFCAALTAYLPALHGGLVWDDDLYITRPVLRSLDGLQRIWLDLGATQQYYPLLHSAFWFEHRLWGGSVFGYHLLNVSLHATAACLVVLIAQRLGLPGSWLAGAIFALHPVCVEGVAWIAEQKDTLSTVFYLAAAYVYLGYDANDRSRSPSRYFLALGFFALALLSKTVTATLPVSLLIIFWWQRGRLRWKRDVLPLAPWFAVGVSAGLFTAWLERTQIRAQGREFDLTLVQRVLVAGRAWWFYPAKLIWPSNLIFIYPRWSIDAHVFSQYLFPVAALALAVALLFLARRNRAPLAVDLLYSTAIFPALGFFNIYYFRFSWVADHFQYLAVPAIVIPAAAVIANYGRRFSLGRAEKAGCAAALAAVLGSLTWARAGAFRNAETLYRTMLERNPACWLAHNDLGYLLANRPGRMPEAISHFRAALQLRPDYAEAQNNLGLAFVGNPELRLQAQAAFEAAIRMNPNLASAHNNLGALLSEMPGRTSDAIAEYEKALRIDPDYADAHCNLALALAKTPGRREEAIDQLEEALRIDPESPRARHMAYELGAFQ